MCVCWLSVRCPFARRLSNGKLHPTKRHKPYCRDYYPRQLEPMAGIEPATSALQVRRYFQLSYIGMVGSAFTVILHICFTFAPVVMNTKRLA